MHCDLVQASFSYQVRRFILQKGDINRNQLHQVYNGKEATWIIRLLLFQAQIDDGIIDLNDFIKDILTSPEHFDTSSTDAFPVGNSNEPKEPSKSCSTK